jgi:cytochrome P450
LQGDGVKPTRFEYDPFSPEAMADPHRFYPTLRSEHPVYRLEAYHGWALSRFADCRLVLQDRDRFSVVEGPLFVKEQLRAPFGLDSIPGADPQRSFSTWDPPEHSRIRRAMASGFSPASIGALEDEMRARADELLAELVPRGGFDVVADLAGPFGLANIGRVIGLELEDLPALFKQIQRSTERNPLAPGFTPSGLAAQGEIHRLVCEAVAAGRGRRSEAAGGAPFPETESVMGSLLGFEYEDRPLDDADLATQLLTLLLGGAETIPKVLAGGLVELARQPDQWRSLLREPALVPAAFEEMMRHQGVLQHVGRTALEDLDVAGQRIRRGDRVFLLLQSANRDEREFPDGERFDVHREPRQHLALGLGRHHCIGSHLARLEAKVLLEAFLTHVSDYRVLEKETRRPPSEFQVGYTRLPIEISARG